MKKGILRCILRALLRDFEKHATSEQITKFKKKYSGMHWKETLETDILRYANTVVALERWTENVIVFMVEQGIAKESEEYRIS